MEKQIIIEIAILFTALYLAFFKSYLTEKGKRAAMKEDIELVTREVESIKNEFTKDQEILKTDLQRILNNEVSYRNEERNALIQFHGMINEWVYAILDIKCAEYDRTSINALVNDRNRIAKYFAKAGISKSKVELLVEDENIIKASSDYYLEALKFHHWSDSKYLHIQQNLESQKRVVDQFLIINNQVTRNRDLDISIANEEKQLKEEHQNLIDNYFSTRNTEYFKVRQL